MSRNEIIAALYTGKNFRDLIGKMEPDHLRDDLMQEVAVIICEYPDEKIIELYKRGELTFYVVRIVLNLVSNKYNAFQKKFRQAFVELNHQPEMAAEQTDKAEREFKEALEDMTLSQINRLYWYDAEMIQLYMKHGSFRNIEAATGIPHESCYKNIKKSLEILRKSAATGQPVPVFKPGELQQGATATIVKTASLQVKI